MNQLLKANQTVRIGAGGAECHVRQFLGGGGQGEVYRADLDGNSVALKWYFPQSATSDQRQALEALIRKGAPNDRFLWPIEIASDSSIPGFGYVMALREPRYKSIVDLMKRRVEPSFRTLATAGRELAHSYLQLHAKGMAYRDISFGNVFFDPKTGEVLICDNDNVTVDSAKKATVLGTPRFMAPEVVRGEALPSTQTDLFSLAVLLFYMLMVHHPLEGKKETAIKCLDLPAMNKLYGTEPVFIFDPADDSNRPDPTYHKNALDFWPIYPQFLQDLFIKAFTDGIRDPQNGRVRESEWRAALARLEDSIVYCGNCRAENFCDPARLSTYTPTCWSCHQTIRLPVWLQIGRQAVFLNHDTKLYPHHTDASRLYDYSSPTAEVNQHPTDPNVWGLKNLSAQRWVVTMPDGSVRDVDAGRSLRLAAGARIQFGTVEGMLKA